MDRIAVIDVETTGLSPWRHDRVIEIAILVISPDGTVHTEYETLVNPNRDIGPSSIHRVAAADLLRAPTFADVAGDVLEILGDASVVAGHNVSFDKAFLVKEYERLGVIIPEIPLLCTCRLFGRNNLQACCDELGISFAGTAHRALFDARATASIVSCLCSDDRTLLDGFRLRGIQWPSIPALKTPCFRREHAADVRREPAGFLQRIASQIRHDAEAQTPELLAYLALIDRVLEDRRIDKNEEDALVEAALRWHLSPDQLSVAHAQYIQNLAALALADGVVTDSERQDLHLVANLLGQDDSTLDGVLERAASQLAATRRASSPFHTDGDLCGQRVCFTGELQATLGGQVITRELAERLATGAGLTVVSSVTKKLDILVVADPNTQSGKAKKARSYGIRILADTVFWRLIGVTVD